MFSPGCSWGQVEGPGTRADLLYAWPYGAPVGAVAVDHTGGATSAIDPTAMPAALHLAQATTSNLPGIVGFVAGVVAAIGLVGIALFVAVENLFPPIPSEVVLPFAGYLAATGEFAVVAAIGAATAGSLVGAVVLYEVGARVGSTRLRRAVQRIPLVEADDIDKGEDWFDRHGHAAVFTGRLVPFVRSVVSIPAGSEEMPRIRFAVLTTLGSGLWNALLTGGGFLLGQQWQRVGRYADWVNYALIAALLVVVARFVYKRRDRFPSPSP